MEDILHAIFSEVLGRYYPTDILLSTFFDIDKEEDLKAYNFAPYKYSIITNLSKIDKITDVTELK